MSGQFRPCGLIPTYDNPTTVGAVVLALREHLPVVVVDDGSGPPFLTPITYDGAGDDVFNAETQRLRRHIGRDRILPIVLAGEARDRFEIDDLLRRATALHAAFREGKDGVPTAKRANEFPGLIDQVVAIVATDAVFA